MVASNSAAPASGRAPSWIATTSISPASISRRSTRRRAPLRGVPGGAAGDDEHLAVAEVRRDRRATASCSPGAHHQHHPAYVGDGERVAHRPGQHRGVAERQQHLVDLGPDPGAGAGGEDHDGGGHGGIVGPRAGCEVVRTS